MLVCKVLVNIVILTLYILFWLLCYVVCNKGINNIVILYTCWPAREYARIFSAILGIHTSKNRHTGSNTRSTIKRSLKSIEPLKIYIVVLRNARSRFKSPISNSASGLKYKTLTSEYWSSSGVGRGARLGVEMTGEVRCWPSGGQRRQKERRSCAGKMGRRHTKNT